MEYVIVISGDDDCFEVFGKSLLGIIRCGGGDMMCMDLVSDWIMMLGGCFLKTSIV